MNQGLLWFDDDPGRDLSEKVARAVQRYRQKYSTAPTICYVHPSALQGKKRKDASGVRVAALASVLRHHLWIGQEET
jgi:hypothetical protein